MIAFASRTGNVRYIVSKLGLPSVEITETTSMKEPFIVFTYTDGLGDVPPIVEKFLQNNNLLCRGVIASGNSNFGHSVFCKAADTISKKYHVPIIRKIELRGFQRDYDSIIEQYQHIFEREGSL